MAKITSLMPTKEDWKRMVAPILRGTAIGSALGILPGSGSILGAFAAYSIEKKVSKHGAEFGKGAIEGVAAPESANNAGAQTSFIPMLTLGIPSNPVMALMVGAMIIQGIQPGPSVITEQPALFWGIIASMWIGNLFLIILNLPLIGMWVRIVTIPYHILFPAILVFCGIGVFSLKNTEFDIYLMALVRGAGLPVLQARLRTGADAAGLYPRADDGRISAPRHAAVPRRSDGLRHASDQRDPAWPRRAGRSSPRASRVLQKARRGLPRGALILSRVLSGIKYFAFPTLTFLI